MTSWSLPAAQRAIIVAGCLAMVYTQLTMSPATIQYARSLGANGLHIGILGALPTLMLFMQFVAAVIVNHLQYRRRLWLAVSLVQRLIMVPLALGPLLLPQWADAAWVWGLIGVTAANHAMLHFCTPLWLSWMGDYLPHRGLSRFWGVRHLWMQWCAALSLLGGALLVSQGWLEIRVAFLVLVGIGAVFGVADLLMFLKVEEPAVSRAVEPALTSVLAAPFREPRFRTFIGYTCFWHFAAMWGAPFISLFLLARVQMDLFHLLLLWTCSWAGGAVFSHRLGRLAERVGSRPVLILCTLFKSLNMIALLLVPAQPDLAFWLLIPVFMVDALLNAGIVIATNGFMLKNSPPENRTMYIAAGTALAGMVGGLTSIGAGAVLAGVDAHSLSWLPAGLDGFQLVFGTSLLLRFVAVFFAIRVQEPHSTGTSLVVEQLVGATPLRMLRFPLGLYRSFREDEVADSVSTSAQQNGNRRHTPDVQRTGSK